ncbi:hypothetical protein Bhyg_09785, partial [Pseudolycoriella hygida]
TGIQIAQMALNTGSYLQHPDRNKQIVVSWGSFTEFRGPGFTQYLIKTFTVPDRTKAVPILRSNLQLAT